MTDMSALDAQQRAGVIAIYFAPNIPPRTSAALIVEHLGGLKRYAWYWLETDTPRPDWKWHIPEDAICLWSEVARPTAMEDSLDAGTLARRSRARLRHGRWNTGVDLDRDDY